jgi:hypothetical protein
MRPQMADCQDRQLLDLALRELKLWQATQAPTTCVLRNRKSQQMWKRVRPTIDLSIDLSSSDRAAAGFQGYPFTGHLLAQVLASLGSHVHACMELRMRQQQAVLRELSMRAAPARHGTVWHSAATAPA